MSFKYRLIIAIIVIESFFIFLIVGLNFFTIDERFNKYIDEKVDGTNILMRELIKAPLSVYDLATLDNIIYNAKNIEDMKYISILDAQGRVVSSNTVEEINFEDYENIKRKQIKKDGNTYVFVKEDIIYEGAFLGHIHIMYDLTDDLSVIEKNKRNTYFLVFIEILISFILVYLIVQNLTLKLLNLSKVASKIGENNFLEVPYLNSKDEIGILSNTMNNMQEQIKSRNKKLNQYAQIFEYTKESIILTDDKGIVIDANNAFLKITGFKASDIIGKKSDILKSNKHPEEFYTQLWNSIITSGYWSGEIINKKKNGELFTSLLNISVLKDSSGVINYVGISTDITKIKEKEKILQTQAKMATLGEMLKNIAHQWRQPLSAITSSASSLLVQKELNLLNDETLGKNLNTIMKTSGFLSQTIEDFRNFFSEDKEAVKFSLEQAILNTINIIKGNLELSNIQLILDLDKDIELIGFENELIQSILNIVNNSKDALSSKTYEKYIFISTKMVEDKIQILVRDNAGGIDEKIIGKIFEPYFTTKHKAQGTGIGLYMTHIIIVEHFNGSILVKNTKYEYKNNSYIGLSSYIYLPNNLLTI